MISFDAQKELFEQPIPKELLKKTVFADFKENSLIGVPDALLDVIFEPGEGHDILVKQVDQEKALGFPVFAGEQEYFESLAAELYVPQEEDFS